jgi:hypothetical protein
LRSSRLLSRKERFYDSSRNESLRCGKDKKVVTYLRTILTGWVPLAEVVKSLHLRLFLHFQT